MATVVIIGILTAVAVPNYRQYVSNAKLIEGQAVLTMARNDAEQFFQDNRSYTNLCTSHTPVSTQNFDYACSASADTYSFTATATATSGISGWAFSINETNTHTTSSVPVGMTAPTGCWAKKVTGTC